jgi:hypothetical protein
MRYEPDMYLGILARRMLHRGRAGPGQGIIGRLEVAEYYRELYARNQDGMYYIANEDNRQDQALSYIEQIVLGQTVE